jgi:hypothetical protein
VVGVFYFRGPGCKSPRESCLSKFDIAAEAAQLPKAIHGVTEALESFYGSKGN